MTGAMEIQTDECLLCLVIISISEGQNPMRRSCVRLLLALMVTSVASAADTSSPTSEFEPFATTDWPWWRGPERNGLAPADQDPPLVWSNSQSILWKVPIAGRGHGSPIVVGNRVVLATAEREAQTRSVICLHRETGEVLWDTIVHQGNATPPRNKKGTQASSSPACDGERFFINFLHDGSMVTSALSLEGKLIWQTKISDYVVHQGYGSSPAIYGPLVIVAADNKSGGALAGLNRATGEIVWKRDRPRMPNYPSPIILEVAGRTQLLMTGCELVSSFDPLSGEALWEIEGATTECVTSTVTDGQLIYTSGGYPKNHVSAVRADGSGEVVWENSSRVYVPSMLVKDGYLYAVTDAGVAMCWKADTGEETWKGRLGGTFTSSPVLVGDRIYATSESGRTFLFQASSGGFELIGVNQLGDECLATPAICGSRIYARVAHLGGDQRQEVLYCIGN